MTKSVLPGDGLTKEKSNKLPEISNLTENPHYSKSRHFEAVRGDRVPHTAEIMPDRQSYSNFAM